MDKDKLDQIWKATLNEIEVDLGKNIFGLHFRNSSLLSFEGGIAKLGFPNIGVANQTSLRYYRLIQSVMQKVTGQEAVSLIFEVKKTLSESKDIGPLFDKEPEIQNESDYAISVRRAKLRLDFTMDEFCVSTSNQLAYAAVSAVVRSPGKSYNPLFLWGGVGVGKTHLMQAVGHEILKKTPKARVVYAPGEQFTNEIIQAIRTKTTAEFKNKYRNADALLIDDIQFFSGKDTAQEEFFHTFNAITQNGGQIVMTSDRKPADISDLADRLKSRFEGGLVADISTPDSELKTAICLLKAKKRGLEISNNLAKLIVDNVDNIRTLEGLLQQIAVTAQISGREITEDFVQEKLKLNRSTQEQTQRLDPKRIMDCVCDYYEVPIKLIKGEKRDKIIALPRQIIMYLLKTNTGMTYEDIAGFIGGRDHTTIMHGVNKIGELILTNSRIKKEVEEMKFRMGITSEKNN